VSREGDREPGSSAVPVDRQRTSRRRLRPVLIGISVSLSTLVACDFVATALLSSLGLYRPPESYRVRHPVYHHGLEPMVSERRAEWGRLRYRVSTSSLGMRDRAARVVPLHAQERRILLLGDSFTEGLGYDFEQTFAGRLADALEGDGVEVLNGAAVSYSPIIYLAKTRHLLETVDLEIDRLVVCLDLSDVHDEARIYLPEIGEGGIRAIDDRMERVRSFIRRRTILVNALNQLNRRRRRAQEGLQLDVFRGRWAHDPAAMELYGREGLRRAGRRLSELAAFLRERDVAMTLVVYPWPDQIARRDRESIQVRHWRDWAAAEGAQFVDLFPVFLDAGPPGRVLRELFIPNDVHWNAEGHRLVAEELVAAIRAGLEQREAKAPENAS